MARIHIYVTYNDWVRISFYFEHSKTSKYVFVWCVMRNVISVWVTAVVITVTSFALKCIYRFLRCVCWYLWNAHTVFKSNRASSIQLTADALLSKPFSITKPKKIKQHLRTAVEQILFSCVRLVERLYSIFVFFSFFHHKQ